MSWEKAVCLYSDWATSCTDVIKNAAFLVVLCKLWGNCWRIDARNLIRNVNARSFRYSTYACSSSINYEIIHPAPVRNSWLVKNYINWLNQVRFISVTREYRVSQTRKERGYGHFSSLRALLLMRREGLQKNKRAVDSNQRSFYLLNACCILCHFSSWLNAVYW